MSSPSYIGRSRSPRYPSHSLNQAIDFASKIYSGVHRSSIDSMTVIKLMGFSGRNGASATALGSVRQFGLIEGVGENTRISDLALRILEPADASERALAIKEAAFLPTVFLQILNRYDGKIPQVNEPIRSYLIRELGFSKKGSDDCLDALRNTVEYVNGFVVEDTSDLVAKTGLLESSNSAFQSPVEPVSNNSQSFAKVNNSGIEDNEGELMMIPLTRDCRASLRFHGQLTERAITNLMRHIELMKDVWAEEE